jgi:hypothetical protein
MSDTKVYQFGTEGAGSLNAVLPFLQQKGIDPAYIMGLMGNNNNGGLFGGRGFEDIIALIIVAALFGNGNGFGFGNGNNRVVESDLLAHMVERNGTDLSQLAQSIGCSTGRLQDAIGAVSTQICNLAGQNGLSFQQVINSIQSGNTALATQICNCCCDIKGAIADSKYATERGFCNTNQILSQGFSSVAYETQRQTCDIEKAIAASTSQIMEGQRAAEMREMQDKLDALREKNAQQAVILNNTQQTAQFAAMLAPIQADLAELKCNQVPVKKIACPDTYVPVNNSINATYGLVPTYCGYGFGGFGFNGWNGGCGNTFNWG